ncbi:MAG: hypothetical protein NTZ05_20645 [Chloroflexi bacterium]|nr:hypothetical protein [Chloroflexota bacterium]
MQKLNTGGPQRNVSIGEAAAVGGAAAIGGYLFYKAGENAERERLAPLIQSQDARIRALEAKLAEAETEKADLEAKNRRLKLDLALAQMRPPKLNGKIVQVRPDWPHHN